MKTLRWTGLSSAEQTELRNLVASNEASDAWAPDYDWLGFMVLAIPAAIAGTIALGTVMGYSMSIKGFIYTFGYASDPALFALRLRSFLYLIPLGLAIWLVVFLVRNWNCRGYAATSFATVKVCGPKLKLIRHDEVASVARRVIRTRKSSFTVLELFDRQGKKSTFYTHGRFADAAIAAIDRAREESASVSRA
jgi:hypothetical protein